MEDSGIDSDSKTGLLAAHASIDRSSDKREVQFKSAESLTLDECPKSCSENHSENEEIAVCSRETYKPIAKLKSSSLLQKRLEKQILQAKKFRLREQSLEGLPKKLIPRNRLNVPKSQLLVVSKTDAHPLVSWESESDEELDYHPISKSSVKEISEQLLKDGYNLDLTPDDEDLDLIPPPKPLSQRCICCSLNCTCLIQ